MNKKILWIEDDFYAIKGLVRPLTKLGYEIDVATSALDGYKKAQQWRQYDLLVVDLIIPVCEHDISIPEIVQSWAQEKHVGIGLAKWLKLEQKVDRPILLLSVVRDPIARFELAEFGLEHCLSKSGLLPTKVKDTVLSLLAVR
jgi:CheY-like chemotaxis protein